MPIVSIHLTGGPLDGQILIRGVDTVPPTTVPQYAHGLDCGDHAEN